MNKISSTDCYFGFVVKHFNWEEPKDFFQRILEFIESSKTEELDYYVIQHFAYYLVTLLLSPKSTEQYGNHNNFKVVLVNVLFHFSRYRRPCSISLFLHLLFSFFPILIYNNTTCLFICYRINIKNVSRLPVFCLSSSDFWRCWGSNKKFKFSSFRISTCPSVLGILPVSLIPWYF